MDLRTAWVTFIVAFVAGACTSAPPARSVGAEREHVKRTETLSGSAEPEDARGDKIVRVAASLIGTPYRFGGDDPKGFDCSGLVFYSFDQLGLEVPRTAADQRHAARPVTLDALEPGDLVFFRDSRRKVNHVGIYAGEGRFIHSPRAGQVVSYAYLDDPYYRVHFVSAGRIP